MTGNAKSLCVRRRLIELLTRRIESYLRAEFLAVIHPTIAVGRIRQATSRTAASRSCTTRSRPR